MTKYFLTPLCGLLIILAIASVINAAPKTQDEPTAAPTETSTETPTTTPSATAIDIRLATRYVETTPRNPVVGEDFFLTVRLANESTVDLRNLTIYLRDINVGWALVPTDGLQNIFWTELLRGQSREFERRYVYQPVSASGREIEIRVEYEYTENQQVKQGVWFDLITLQVLNPTATPTPSLTPTSTFTPPPTPIPPATPVPSPATPIVVTVVVEVTPSPTPTHAGPTHAVTPEPPADNNMEDPAAMPARSTAENTPTSAAPPQHLILDLGKTPLTVYPGEFFAMSLRAQNIGMSDVSGIVMTWQGFRYTGDGERYIFIHASAQNWLLGGVRAGGVSIPAQKTFFVSHDAPTGVHRGEVEISYVIGGGEHYQTVFDINLLVMPK